MDDSMDIENPQRIIDLIIFQQRFETNFQNIYEKICEVSKRMEKIEDVNQAFRDENQKLTLTNENKNTTIDVFQRKFLVMEDQLKKRFPTPFTVLPQRNPKFLDPEQFGGARDEFEPFKFNFKTKFQANGDWYFTGKKNSITLFRVSKTSFKTKSFLK